jgi:xanthine dehydrogenase accessory factor
LSTMEARIHHEPTVEADHQDAGYELNPS